jgi:hypothetical protein
MIEVTILIPLADNAGAEFSAKHHEVFETFLAKTFGGVTRVPGVAWGVWFQGDIRYDDRNVAYLVALGSLTEGGRLHRAVEIAKSHYQQEAIFLRYLGIVEIR